MAAFAAWLTATSVFLQGCAKPDRWLALAHQYRGVERRLDPSKASFGKEHARLMEVEAALRAAPAPSTNEIALLLSSRCDSDRADALIVMEIQQIHDRRLVVLALQSFGSAEFYTRYRGARFLAGLSRDQVSAVADGLVEARRPEKNALVLATATPAVEKLDQAHAVRLIGDLMARGDLEVTVAMFPLAARRGIVGEVRSVLAAAGNTKALRLVEDVERASARLTGR